MTANLARVDRRVSLEPSSIEEAWKVARITAASGMFGVKSPEEACVRIMTGVSLGLTAMQSLRGIHVIKGRPVLSADMMEAIALSSGVCDYFRCEFTSAERTVYVTRRAGQPEQRLEWTFEQASKIRVDGQQLTAKEVWRNYPDAMLRARCIAALARIVYPDLLLGVYTQEELAEQPAAPTTDEVAAEVLASAPRRATSEPPPRLVQAQYEARALPPKRADDPWDLGGEVPAESHVPRADPLALTPPRPAQHATLPASSLAHLPAREPTPSPPPARESPRGEEPAPPPGIAGHIQRHRLWMPATVTLAVKPKAKGEKATKVEKSGRERIAGLLAHGATGEAEMRKAIDAFWGHVGRKALGDFVAGACAKTGADAAAILAEVDAGRLTVGTAAIWAEEGITPPLAKAAAPASDDDPETVASKYVADAREAANEGDLDELAAALREDPRLGGEHRARAETAIGARRVTLEKMTIGDRENPS